MTFHNNIDMEYISVDGKRDIFGRMDERGAAAADIYGAACLFTPHLLNSNDKISLPFSTKVLRAYRFMSS